jgi:putative nucleotidyltransferase with HDIG domain
VFVPFAAIMIASLINANVAIFITGFLTIILAVTLAFERQGFMVMNLAAAFVAILSTKALRQRKEVFVVCFKGWLCAVAVIFSIQFYQGHLLTEGVFSDILSSAFFLMLTAVLVIGLLPLFESGFKIMTDATLMEYMDPNNPLLRSLAIESPGTYQHSIVVGHLAESAALAIGANGLFCRVATLYHDIGKTKTPQYFSENQANGVNIHQLLTPKESAEVILAHVPEGVALARKGGLPEQFIDVIKEHHGTSLVYYFYRQELERLGNDKTLVEEKQFRYSGPLPRTKEGGIIMIADMLEAASRSLQVIDEASTEELADRLIRDKLMTGQLDESLLTLKELAIVKATLVKMIVAFSHSRVKYPKVEDRINLKTN